MKFKIDENLPLEFCELLRSEGFDAKTVLDQGLGGASDDLLFRQCFQESRILMTLDMDFSNIWNYSPGGTSGIIVFRLLRHDKPSLISALRKTIPTIMEHGPQNSLWIVEHDRIRMRDRV